MRPRPLAAIPLALVSSAAACQAIWSYGDFKDQPGTGGSVTGSSASSPSSSGGGTTSSTAESSTNSTSSSSGDGGCTGGPPGAACTDPCDIMAILAHEGSIQPDVYDCTVESIGGPNPACIAAKDDLSMACAACWAAVGPCGAQWCAAYCGTGAVNSAGCNQCLAAHCDCAFKACSGTDRPAEADAGADASCD
jgi:hypothetical protein